MAGNYSGKARTRRTEETEMKVHKENKGEGSFLKGCLATLFCCWLCCQLVVQSTSESLPAKFYTSVNHHFLSLFYDP
ncbi:hypothetical protein ACOSQ2_014341 [Xanthoceras sorbifolium]